MSGPPLGRPPANISQEKRKQAQEDERIRNAIEGKFGISKRRFSLNRVMAKLPHTSQTAIAITFLVMNLSALLRQFFCLFYCSKQQNSFLGSQLLLKVIIGGIVHNKLMVLEPEVIFYESINGRGVNIKRMVDAGLDFAKPLVSERVRAENFLRQWEQIEEAARQVGCLDKLHIWPDKSLKKYTESQRGKKGGHYSTVR